MKRIIFLLAVSLLINCSSNEEELIPIESSIIGNWEKTTVINKEVENYCIKSSRLKIKEDGSYTYSNSYEIKDANNNRIFIDFSDTELYEVNGTWKKNSINKYILTDENLQYEKKYIAKKDIITEISTNSQWKRVAMSLD